MSQLFWMRYGSKAYWCFFSWQMIGQDEKVICVPVSDPIWNSLNDLSDMNPHLLKE
jgi:hypothetical protein